MKDLKNSDEKIVVIAQKHGFQNLEYFQGTLKRRQENHRLDGEKQISETNGLETEGTYLNIRKFLL